MSIKEKFQLLDEAVNTPTITDIQAYQQIVDEINLVHGRYQNMPDDRLAKEIEIIVSEYDAHHEDRKYIISAFALIKEVCFRQLGLLAFDAQLIAGLVMLEGRLAEMQTGEGKTLAAVFPAIYHGLSKKGVHVLTFNDYLAQRDAEWMKPVAEMFGLSVRWMKEGFSKSAQKNAFAADILYASAKEVAYCYLRNRGAYEFVELVMRPFHYAIVDEADAVLIDEAKNPLVMAGKMDMDLPDFYEIDSFVKSLKSGEDFQLGKYARSVFLTDPGRQKVEEIYHVSEMTVDQNRQFMSAVHLSLHANQLLHRDVDYIIKNDKIKLVDALTGRIIEDRKWRNGLQTAVEAKEKVTLRSEGSILLSTSMQHFMLRYPKLAAMTATARESSNEFKDYYSLQVVVIPPVKESKRVDLPDRVFPTKQLKYTAIIDQIKEIHRTGQPVLVGTMHIKESELIYQQLKEEGIACQVLNAKNDEEEAAIIKHAGEEGNIVISTNMAGRGTDIKLGGEDGSGREVVVNKGGLFVLGTNRHESKRIDRQLIGRSGRQGDPGCSQFFISLEDDLMEQYQLSEVLPKKFKSLDTSLEVSDLGILMYIDHIQEVVDGQGYQMRKTIFEYSSIAEYQDALLEMDRAEIFQDTGSASLVQGYLGGGPINEGLLARIRVFALSLIDKTWAHFLNDIQEKKEAIGFIKLGGISPLREYRKYCHQQFDLLKNQLNTEIKTGIENILSQDNLTDYELGMSRPSSTWTYTVNDKLFADQLAMLLMDSGNLGMQADPFSGALLFARGLWKKFRSPKK